MRATAHAAKLRPDIIHHHFSLLRFFLRSSWDLFSEQDRWDSGRCATPPHTPPAGLPHPAGAAERDGINMEGASSISLSLLLVRRYWATHRPHLPCGRFCLDADSFGRDAPAPTRLASILFAIHAADALAGAYAAYKRVLTTARASAPAFLAVPQLPSHTCHSTHTNPFRHSLDLQASSMPLPL